MDITRHQLYFKPLMKNDTRWSTVLNKWSEYLWYHYTRQMARIYCWVSYTLWDHNSQHAEVFHHWCIKLLCHRWQNPYAFLQYLVKLTMPRALLHIMPIAAFGASCISLLLDVYDKAREDYLCQKNTNFRVFWIFCSSERPPALQLFKLLFW